MTYGYNLAGALTTITYPSGRTVTYGYDAIARLSQIQSLGTNYVSNVAYNAANLPTSFAFGNGVQASFSYNARLQLSSLAYSQASLTLLSLIYGYGTGNNGQIQSITDNVDSTRTATYTYDAWARLKTAQTGQWGLSWTYDRFGNRKAQSVTLGTGPANAVTIDPNTNRITDPGYSYDAAGNLAQDGLNSLVYDAENRIVSSTASGATAAYTYDGNGLRVKKTSGGSTTVYIFSGKQVIAEYQAGAAVGSPAREYIYSGSALIATIEGATTKYHLRDHLSVRVNTDASGIKIGEEGHHPFGESWYSASTTTKWQFTSYERDSESGNDYALARYYVNRLGRFNAPDPLAGSIRDPQSLNRYAYVRNDPVNRTDPLGLWDDVWDGIHLMYIDSGGAGGSGGYVDPILRCFSAVENNWGCLMNIAEARDRAFWGDRWYDLPGHSNPMEEAERQYDRMVAEGRANLARNVGEKQK